MCFFTMIMHSWQSCGNWMIKNRKAKLMRNPCVEHKNKQNGGLDHKGFHLAEDMSSYTTQIKQKDRNSFFVLS